jgi:hypothetical protein
VGGFVKTGGKQTDMKGRLLSEEALIWYEVDDFESGLLEMETLGDSDLGPDILAAPVLRESRRPRS